MGKQLESLRKQREAIEERIKLLEAKERSEDRKRDTRKKIVVGAYFLEKMEKDEAFNAKVLADLEKRLKRKIDRDLFGFRTAENGSEKSAKTWQ